MPLSLEGFLYCSTEKELSFEIYFKSQIYNLAVKRFLRR